MNCLGSWERSWLRWCRVEHSEAIWGVPPKVPGRWQWNALHLQGSLQVGSPVPWPVFLVWKREASISSPSHPTRSLIRKLVRVGSPTVTFQCGTGFRGLRLHENMWYNSQFSRNSRYDLKARYSLVCAFHIEALGGLESRSGRSGRPRVYLITEWTQPP